MRNDVPEPSCMNDSRVFWTHHVWGWEPAYGILRLCLPLSYVRPWRRIAILYTLHCLFCPWRLYRDVCLPASHDILPAYTYLITYRAVQLRKIR